MMLADAHLHLFRRGFPGVYGQSLLGPEVEVYERLRAVHAIAAGLVVGYEGEGIDALNNSYIRSLAADRPWMATVAYIDAHAVPSAKRLSSLFEAGHRGIALYISDPAGAETIAGWPSTIWRLLNKYCAILSLNVSPDFVSALAGAIEAIPDCALLISHLGLPGRYPSVPDLRIATARLAPMLTLATLPNAYVKISGLYAISSPSHDYPHEAAVPFIDLVLERFGPGRCLWGSDFSPALDHVSFAQTVHSPWLDRLEDSHRADVMGRNLMGLLDRARVSSPP